MDERELLLNTISDLDATINDTMSQVAMLGDRVRRGTLTTSQAEEFRIKWRDYVENATKLEQVIMEKLFQIAINK